MLGFSNVYSQGGGWIRITSSQYINSDLNRKIIVCQANNIINLTTGNMNQDQENVIVNIGTKEVKIQSISTEDGLKVNGSIKGWCTIAPEGTVYTKFNNGFLEIYGVVAASGSNLITEVYLFNNGSTVASWTKNNHIGITYNNWCTFTRSATVSSTITVETGLRVAWTWNQGAGGYEPYDTQSVGYVSIQTSFDMTNYNHIIAKAAHKVTSGNESMSRYGYISINGTKQYPTGSESSPNTLTWDVSSLTGNYNIVIYCDGLSESEPSHPHPSPDTGTQAITNQRRSVVLYSLMATNE